MKDKSFVQSANEREAAFEYVAAGLPSESLNGSPERKRAIYGAFEARDARFDGRVYAAISNTDPVEQVDALLSVRGIGPWTANYIAMHAYSYPDAFLEKDSGVAHALPDMTPKERLEAVEPCRPWRSYAVICLWNSLGDQATKPKGEQPS